MVLDIFIFKVEDERIGCNVIKWWMFDVRSFLNDKRIKMRFIGRKIYVFVIFFYSNLLVFI